MCTCVEAGHSLRLSDSLRERHAEDDEAKAANQEEKHQRRRKKPRNDLNRDL